MNEYDIALKVLENEEQAARDEWGFWADAIGNPHFRKMLDQMREEITNKKELLTHPANKAEIDKALKAEIVARKDLVERLKAKGSQEKLRLAENKVKEYKRENAMFFSATAGPQEVDGADAKPAGKRKRLDPPDTSMQVGG